MFLGYRQRDLYDLVERYRSAMAPVHELAILGLDAYKDYAPLTSTEFGRRVIESINAAKNIILRGERSEFGIRTTTVAGIDVPVSEVITARRTFCDLLHFQKLNAPPQKKMMIFAPMAGHFSTLLRRTVDALLPHFDVYITDWKNARDVPLSEGGFDFEDYISYAIDFMQAFDERVNVMAVCQPTVPVLCAIALMSARQTNPLPENLILIGGPIDPRRSPTQVNSLAVTQREDWFVDNLLTIVPQKYPGAMRTVYPGFLQLHGFLSMNFPRHLRSAQTLIRNITLGADGDVEKTAEFYTEYFTVMDLTAEFYMQTIKRVFKEFALPEGTMTWRDGKVDCGAIKDVGIMAIEGAEDDIAGVGQTKAALDLCKSVPSSRKRYLLQNGVGHYGVFSGKTFERKITPEICTFIGI